MKQKRNRVRKLISLLLVMALMSTCLGIGSVSVSADSASCDAVVTKRGLCISGWHNDTDPSITKGPKQYEPRFYIDLDAMGKAFSKSGVVKPIIYKNETGSVEKVYEKIKEVFQASDSNDINYLFLNGHGAANDGFMCVGGKPYLGLEKERLYYSTLKAVIDKFNKEKDHGHFIIFIHACYSGQAINKSKAIASGNEQYDEEIITDSENILDSFFSDEITASAASDFTGTAGNTRYTVFCSSLKTQYSWGQRLFDCAPYAWAKGLGWQMYTDKKGGMSCDRKADKNNDGIVTVSELNKYTNEVLKNEFNIYSKEPGSLDNPTQAACYYSRYYFRTVGTKDYPLGDPDQDGDITNKDILLIRKFIAGQKTPVVREKKLSDVNGDKEITNKDVLILQYFLAGLSLPQVK